MNLRKILPFIITLVLTGLQSQDLAAQCFDGLEVFTFDRASEVVLCEEDAPITTTVVRMRTNRLPNPVYYLITDENNTIVGVEQTSYVDFAEFPVGNYRIWGVSYKGTVTAEIGANAAETQLSDLCFNLSDNFVFVQNGCEAGFLQLQVLHNNDGESELLTGEDGIGGVAQFKTVLDSLRGLGIPSITLSSGDNFLPGPEFNASLALDSTARLFDAIALDALGYNALCIGNHDFDFGPEILARLIEDFENTMPPYLSANLDFSEEPVLQVLVESGRIAGRTILDVDGDQVGVIGLTTPSLPTVSSPRNVRVDSNLVGVVESNVAALEESGVNKIILISHLQSINEELDLAAQISGIDIIIAGGGDELLLNDSTQVLPGDEIFDSYPLVTQDADSNEVYIVTTRGNYSYVGNLIVTFDEEGNIVEIDDRSDAVLVSGFPLDSALQNEVVDPVAAYVASLDSNIIATTEVALDGRRGSVRTIETNQGNLIADALLWQGLELGDEFGLDTSAYVVGFQNGGGIRNDEIIPAGSEISELTTFDMLPFSNFVSYVNAIDAETLKSVMENSVSRIEDVSGRFAQIAGFSVVYSLEGTPDSNRIISITMDDGTEVVSDGEVVAPEDFSVVIVTNSFTAGGGDDYDEFATAGFSNLPVSYQRALFNYIVENLEGVISAEQYPEGGEGRITTGELPEGGSGIEDSELDFTLIPLASYQTGIFDEGAAEIVAHDPINQRLFFTNSDENTVNALDISNPFSPAELFNIDMSVYGDGVNSVAVKDSLVAVAVEAEAVDANGSVVFFDLDGNFLAQVEAGVLPDMVTFTNDGTKVLTANEGEPNDEYTIDPEGSISIIDISEGVTAATVNTATFEAFNDQIDDLRAAGVRIFGPGATVAQDLEPEYIAVTTDDAFAIVALQENNAIAKVNIETATVEAIVPLGFKDHSLEGNGFDASNVSESVDISPRPTLGMYQPDAIKAVNLGGVEYVVTANEGDARDYDGFSEEERVADLLLDSVAYPNAAELQLDENLGRLNSTTATGDIDGDGDIDQIYSYGARSFSIWDADGNLIFDSGNDLELRTFAAFPDNFNANNDDNELKARSDDKGPEPEAVEIATLGDNTFALVGLERIGGIAVYEINDPTAPKFVDYTNNRNFDEDPETGMPGDLGPEDIRFIPAEISPVGVALVVTANEVSGTVSIFAVNEMPDMPATPFALRILHNNDGESQLLPDDEGLGGVAQFKAAVDQLRSDSLATLMLSSGDNYLPGPEFNASLAQDSSARLFDAIALDAIGYDALCIGNHDFDFGPDILERLILDFENATPPYLSANLDFSEEPGLQALVDAGRIAPSTVIERDGEQIGVIGLTTTALPEVTSPRNVRVDSNLVMAVNMQVDQFLADSINKIILISHLQSINEELELAAQLTDIDIIIAGGGDELLTNDTSNVIDGQEIFGEYPLPTLDADSNTVYIVTTPGNYRFVGQLIVEFDEAGVVTSIDEVSDLVKIQGFEPDSALVADVETPVSEFVADLDSNIIAKTEVALDGLRGNVRTRETNQGNLIADGLLWQALSVAEEFDIDTTIYTVAMQGGGGIRNDEVIPAESEISELKTFDILPFSNFVSIVNPIDAATFKASLENSVSRIEDVNGRFSQISGFRVVYDTTQAAGSRVVSVIMDDSTVVVENGEVVAPAEFEVQIVTNSFQAGGGDGYTNLEEAGFRNIGFSYQQSLFNYITQVVGPTITADEYPEGGEGRITFLEVPAIVGGNVPQLASAPVFSGELQILGNPFTNQLTYNYEVEKDGTIELFLTDLNGQRVATFFRGYQLAGQYQETHNVGALNLANGTYLLTLRNDAGMITKMLIKQ